MMVDISNLKFGALAKLSDTEFMVISAILLIMLFVGLGMMFSEKYRGAGKQFVGGFIGIVIMLIFTNL